MKNENETGIAAGSWAWWLLPTFLGIIGGVIAYAATKGSHPVRRRDYLIVGAIVSFQWIVLVILNGVTAS